MNRLTGTWWVGLFVLFVALPLTAYGLQAHPRGVDVAVSMQDDSTATVTASWTHPQADEMSFSYYVQEDSSAVNGVTVETTVSYDRLRTEVAVTETFCVLARRLRDGKESRPACTAYTIPRRPPVEEPPPEPPTPPDVVVDTLEVPPDTTPPPEPPDPPAGGTCVSEAACAALGTGWTPVSDNPFNSLTDDDWTIVAAPNASIVSDPTAPHSAGNVLRCTYPAGLPGGGGNQCRLSRGIRYLGDFREIYVAYWIKLSPNWQGHSSGVIKTTYVQFGSPDGEIAVDAHGQDLNPLRPQITSGASPQSTCGVSGVLSLQSNVPGVTTEIRRGEWQLFEVWMRLGTAGNCDGAVKWWLNGVKVMDHDGVLIQPSGGSPDTWRKINHDPIWGGTGDTVEQTMWIDMDHFWISGR